MNVRALIGRAIAGVVTVVAATGLAAASHVGAGGESGGTLTIAINGDPQSLDPGVNGTGYQSLVQWLSYEPLIRAKADGSFEPGLAESWEYVGEGNTTFEMTLREGVTFADGDPVTSEAVVATIEYFIATPSPVHSAIETVEAVEAVDDRTVRVMFSEANPSAQQLFSQVSNYGDIISPTGLADPEQLGTTTHGAGPYQLDTDETVTGDHYAFVRNDNYWNPELQHWDQVVVRIIGDPNTAFNALRTGQIDVDTVTTPAQLPEAEAAGLEIVGGLGTPIIVWIMDRNGEGQPALADVRVRQALNMAIDRPTIAAAMGEAYAPLSQFVPPGAEGYIEDFADIAYDPEGAQALLEEAGYGDGFTLELATNTDNRDDDVSQILVEQWGAIGVEVNLRTYDNQPSEMFSALAEKQHHAITFAFGLNVAGMVSQLSRPALFNPFGVTDPEVNAAFERWALAPEGESGDAALEVTRAINDLAWFVPVASVESFIVADGERVANLGSLAPNGLLYDVLDWTPAG